MYNRYVENLLNDARKKQEGDLLNCTSTEYTDTQPFSLFLTNVVLGSELKDETFDFKAFSTLTANLYALFLAIDKLGGSVNKNTVELILQINEFTAQKTNEKGISLVQSMLRLMVKQFLGNTLTSKPIDAQTRKTVVFDKDDKDKDYSDKYFSFVHNGKRYVVKTNTFDLSDILSEL